MAMRKICPDAAKISRPCGSRTHPVPSIAAWFAGSTRTANIASAVVLMVMLALIVSAATLPPFVSSVETICISSVTFCGRLETHDKEPAGSMRRSCDLDSFRNARRGAGGSAWAGPALTGSHADSEDAEANGVGDTEVLNLVVECRRTDIP